MTTTASGVTIPGTAPTTTPITPLETVFNNLGNSLDGRLVIPVASDAAEASLLANFGATAAKPLTIWRSDKNQLKVHNGTAWTWPNGLIRGGWITTTADADGFLPALAHGLPRVPDWVQVTYINTGIDAVDKISSPILASVDATNLRIRMRRTDTNNWFNGNPASYYWSAGLNS